MTAYSEKLRDPRWQKKRLRIFKRDKWVCSFCSDATTTLNVHHERYIGSNPWDTPACFLKTVCKECHSIIDVYQFIQQKGVILKAQKIRYITIPSDFVLMISCIVNDIKKLVVVIKEGEHYSITPIEESGVAAIKNFISDF